MYFGLFKFCSYAAKLVTEAVREKSEWERAVLQAS